MFDFLTILAQSVTVVPEVSEVDAGFRFDAIRGAIAAAAIISTLVTLSVFFYARGFEEKVSAPDTDYRVRMVKTLRRLVGLNLVALVILAACYLIRFFYAMPRPRLQPEFVFYSDALTYYVGLFHIVFPALILFFMVRGAYREERAK